MASAPVQLALRARWERGCAFLLISGMRDERALSTTGWNMRFSEALGYNESALYVLSKKLVIGNGADIGDKQGEARGT